MRTYSVHEAKTHLSKLLRQVAAGEEVIITSNGERVARLSAVEKQKKPRVGGQFAEQIVIPDDFDTPMPEEWFGSDDKFSA